MQNVIKIVYLFGSIPVFDTICSVAIDKTFKQDHWLEHTKNIHFILEVYSILDYRLEKSQVSKKILCNFPLKYLLPSFKNSKLLTSTSEFLPLL